MSGKSCLQSFSLLGCFMRLSHPQSTKGIVEGSKRRGYAEGHFRGSARFNLAATSPLPPFFKLNYKAYERQSTMPRLRKRLSPLLAIITALAVVICLVALVGCDSHAEDARIIHVSSGIMPGGEGGWGSGIRYYVQFDGPAENVTVSGCKGLYQTEIEWNVSRKHDAVTKIIHDNPLKPLCGVTPLVISWRGGYRNIRFDVDD